MWKAVIWYSQKGNKGFWSSVKQHWSSRRGEELTNNMSMEEIRCNWQWQLWEGQNVWRRLDFLQAKWGSHYRDSCAWRCGPLTVISAVLLWSDCILIWVKTFLWLWKNTSRSVSRNDSLCHGERAFCCIDQVVKIHDNFYYHEGSLPSFISCYFYNPCISVYYRLHTINSLWLDICFQMKLTCTLIAQLIWNYERISVKNSEYWAH